MEEEQTEIQEDLQVDDLKVKTDEQPEIAVTGPDPSEAEVQAKTDAMPNLSEPKPPVAPPSSPGMTVEEVREKYEALNNLYEEVCTSKDACEIEMTRLNKEMAVLKPYITEKIDPKENQRGIMRYIQTQNKIRKAKAERINTVLQGLKVHDILPNKGSKLDLAMSRKTARGLHRPYYPNQANP